jgi:hypothetical protein
MTRIKAEIRKEFLEAGKLYISRFEYPKSVYYPGCGVDATPGIVFEESRLVFLDTENWRKQIIKAVPTATFVHGDARSYRAGYEFDLVIDIHSHAPFVEEARELKTGGHLIIATKGSDRAFDSSSFGLVGAMVMTQDGTLELVTEQLEKFREEAETSSEFSFSNRRKIKANYYVFQKRS